MRLAVIFISFFFLLSGGGSNVFARNYHNITSSTSVIQKAKQAKFTVTDQASFENINLSEEEKYLSCEEVDDEDADDDVSVKKYKSAAGHHSISSYQYVLHYHYNCTKALQFIWCQVSCRYILQRTLRI